MTKWLLKKLFKIEIKKLFLGNGDMLVLQSEDIGILRKSCDIISDILPEDVGAIGLTSDVTIEKLELIPEEMKDMLREIL